jgi:hypothetical protein
MSSTTSTTTTASSPVSIGNRARLVLVGLAASAVLAGGVAVVLDDGDGTATIPSSISQSLRGSGGVATVDPRPDIDPRTAAAQFHHRLASEPTQSASSGIDPRPDIDQRRVKERFNHR